MLGISWRRQQGLADPLLKRMLTERGLDNVPQWTKEGDVRMRANRRWTALAVDRSAAVDPGPPAPWLDELPPDDGWSRVDDVPAAELDELARLATAPASSG